MSSNIHSASYRSSSSTFESLGPDGQRESREARSEHSSIDGVGAGTSIYRDSLGNERQREIHHTNTGRREAVRERIGGEERQFENVEGIDKDKFPSEWQKAAERVDPEGKLLNRQLNLHGALEGSQQKSLK